MFRWGKVEQKMRTLTQNTPAEKHLTQFTCEDQDNLNDNLNAEAEKLGSRSSVAHLLPTLSELHTGINKISVKKILLIMWL